MDRSERALLVQRIADYANEDEELVALAFDEADGDIIDTLTCLSIRSVLRRRIERKHCERTGKQYYLPRP